MPLSVVVQPDAADEVHVIEKSPVGPQLIVEMGSAYLSVQVDRDVPGGAELVAVFARQFARAAIRFARCCEGDEDDEAPQDNALTLIDQKDR